MEIFTLPSYFFFGMVAPLNLVEFDDLAPCDTILLIRCIGYVKSVLSGATSRHTTSMGAFKHPRAPANDDGNSNW
jgi:hypothetical protein